MTNPSKKIANSASSPSNPPRPDSIIDVARYELIEPQVFPLLLRAYGLEGRSSWLLVFLVMLAMVALPCVATAVLFFLPSLVASWADFAGLMLIMCLLMVLLISGLVRTRRWYLKQNSLQRLQSFNERAARRGWTIVNAVLNQSKQGNGVGGEDALAGKDSEVIFFLQHHADSLIRLSFLVQYKSSFIKASGLLARKGWGMTNGLLGISFWASGNDSHRCIVAFLTVMPGANTRFLENQVRLADLPFNEMLRALEQKLKLPIKETSHAFLCGRTEIPEEGRRRVASKP